MFGQKCPAKMKRNEVVLALLAHIQDELYKPLDPNALPNHMTGINLNEEALKHLSRGQSTRLVPGTVIERDYQGKTCVDFCRAGYYEYNQKRHGRFSDISEEIAKCKFPDPAFFSVKSRMYLLDPALMLLARIPLCGSIFLFKLSENT